jgi:hypothetical protein
MAKAVKTPPEDAKRNKESAKEGKRVRCKIGKLQREFIGTIKGFEGNFALVLFDGDAAATRVYPSICYPE